MLIALPDLHGRADLLDAALGYYPPDAAFVFLGDAIDRGPDSRGTVRRLLELSDADRVTLLRGNHEVMLATAIHYDRLRLETGDPALAEAAQRSFVNWQRNGGSSVSAEYDHFEPHAAPPELIDFLERTRLVFDAPGGHVLSHAAPPAWVERFPTVEEAIVWARPQDGPFPLAAGVPGSVHGHTPLAAPTWVGQHLYMDLGAVHTGALATLDLESFEMVVLQGAGRVSREQLPELVSSEDGLVRPHPFRVVEV